MKISSGEFDYLSNEINNDNALSKDLEKIVEKVSRITGNGDIAIVDVVEYLTRNWETLSKYEYTFVDEIRRIIGKKRYDDDFDNRFSDYLKQHPGSNKTEFYNSIFKIHKAAAKKTAKLFKLQYPVICEYSRHFGLNPDYFLFPDEVSEETRCLRHDEEKNGSGDGIHNYYSDACVLFTDFIDNTVFYGYCSSTTGTQIDKFRLIFSENGEAALTLTAANNHRRVDDTIVVKKFKGTPIKIRENVVIPFTRCDNPQKDDIFILMFKLGGGNEYCYKGALLTTHRHSDKRCEIQEFCMFDRELPLDNPELTECLKGFLKLSSTADRCVSSINQFVVEKRVFDAISEETGSFAGYGGTETICYIINEDGFLNEYKDNSPEQFLLRLKSKSINPSKIDIDVPAPGDKIIDFFYDKAKDGK